MQRMYTSRFENVELAGKIPSFRTKTKIKIIMTITTTNNHQVTKLTIVSLTLAVIFHFTTNSDPYQILPLQKSLILLRVHAFHYEKLQST